MHCGDVITVQQKTDEVIAMSDENGQNQVTPAPAEPRSEPTGPSVVAVGGCLLVVILVIAGISYGIAKIGAKAVRRVKAHSEKVSERKKVAAKLTKPKKVRLRPRPNSTKPAQARKPAIPRVQQIQQGRLALMYLKLARSKTFYCRFAYSFPNRDLNQITHFGEYHYSNGRFRIQVSRVLKEGKPEGKFPVSGYVVSDGKRLLIYAKFDDGSTFKETLATSRRIIWNKPLPFVFPLRKATRLYKERAKAERIGDNGFKLPGGEEFALDSQNNLAGYSRPQKTPKGIGEMRVQYLGHQYNIPLSNDLFKIRD